MFARQLTGEGQLPPRFEKATWGQGMSIGIQQMGIKDDHKLYSLLVLSLLLTIEAPAALAAEGASSNYFPGSYGDFAVAVAPAAGFTYINYNLFVDAKVDRAVLQGSIDVNLETSAYINMSTVMYTFEQSVLGGQFAVLGYLPVGYADLDADLAGRNSAISVSDSETAFGDFSLTPASFYWNTGNWYFNLYELIVIPTGQYELENNINLGRNYWSFDTVFSATNLNLETGREYSLVTGYMINRKNDDTDYETGDELHFDAMFNQFLSETFAIGLHGYYYKQVTGDNGDGALLGDFKGESYGLGPSFFWVPASGEGAFSVSGAWLHDLHATNRLESDYAQLTLVWQFGINRE
jgi:hypothetical protein